METPTTPRSTLNPPVFYTSAALILALVLFTVLLQEEAQSLFNHVQQWIITNASWFYVLAVALILISVVFLAVSRYGDIKLGPDHSRPDYRNTTWFAMLFSAGMGIGLMFFGVAEPVMHFTTPPVGEPNTVQAAKEAMKLTFFHWGLHAWAIYAIVALILAFFSYRHGLPLTLRSALYPLIGERIYGPIGHAVDIFAIIGTVFGVATSLGYGVLQINSGLHHLFGWPVNQTVQIALIAATCGLATLSVASGLDRGIRILSELNLSLAVILLLFVLVLGPTVFLLQTYVQNTGAYLSDIVNKTFNLYAYEPTDWIGGWTLLYWGWWLSWSPFVGLFIARISRGRTIREFVCGVLFVPAGFTLLWMTVFGDTAIHMVLQEGFTQLAEVVNQDSSVALFAFLEHFPLGSVISLVAVLMVVVFFVTSADSGALVVDMLASSGKDHSPLWQRIFWSVLMGVVAIALLLADGLKALQTATIASALPFSIVLLASIWGLFKALHLDATKRGIRYQALTFSRPTTRSGASEGDGWQRRLRNIAMFPRRSHVNRFITDVARPACEDVAAELRKQGYEVQVQDGEDGRVRLEVSHGGEVDFIYEVRPRAFTTPSFVMRDTEDSSESRKYFRAEVHLQEGGQDYDIMGWSRDGVIGDILDQYERHMISRRGGGWGWGGRPMAAPSPFRLLDLLRGDDHPVPVRRHRQADLGLGGGMLLDHAVDLLHVLGLAVDPQVHAVFRGAVEQHVTVAVRGIAGDQDRPLPAVDVGEDRSLLAGHPGRRGPQVGGHLQVEVGLGIVLALGDLLARGGQLAGLAVLQQGGDADDVLRLGVVAIPGVRRDHPHQFLVGRADHVDLDAVFHQLVVQLALAAEHARRLDVERGELVAVVIGGGDRLAVGHQFVDIALQFPEGEA